MWFHWNMNKNCSLSQHMPNDLSPFYLILNGAVIFAQWKSQFHKKCLIKRQLAPWLLKAHSSHKHGSLKKLSQESTKRLSLEWTFCDKTLIINSFQNRTNPAFILRAANRRLVIKTEHSDALYVAHDIR